MVTKARPSNTGPNLAFNLRHWTLPYRPQSGCQPRENGQSHHSAALPLCPNPTMSPAPLPCARIAALHPHDHQPQTANQGSSNHQSRQKPQRSCMIKAHQGKRRKYSAHPSVGGMEVGIWSFPSFPIGVHLRQSAVKFLGGVLCSRGLRISRLPHPPNQGKNTSNQALSCLIKATLKTKGTPMIINSHYLLLKF